MGHANTQFDIITYRTWFSTYSKKMEQLSPKCMIQNYSYEERKQKKKEGMYIQIDSGVVFRVSKWHTVLCKM